MKRMLAPSATFLFIILVLAVGVSTCRQSGAPKSQIDRGAYLVMLGGCDDCHSPKIMTMKGPVVDTTRRLSGHPGGSTMPPVPAGLIGPTGWGAVTTNDLTAWSGPWGTSFAYNLTPDNATGIGLWDENMFIQTLRTGKFMGMSRDILPPMPWQAIGRLTDDDLKDIFAFLKSLPAVNNPIPAPLPPQGPGPEAKGKK